MKLPPHLENEVAWWLAFRRRHNLPEQSSPYWAARFVLECLTDKSLATRSSCINALSEYHRVYLGIEDPFKANPWPYPLMRRYLPQSFSALFYTLKHSDFTDAERSCVALVLVCGASQSEAQKWSGSVVENVVHLDGRLVPLTDTVARWCGSPGNRDALKTGMKKLGVSIAEAHGALAAELIRLKVPEVTRAAVYGRWSAMKYEIAEKPKGLFRGPIPGNLGF